ncbi:MAG: hypothetical protein ACFB9M_09905 [Myxococcota bacterium]
MHEEPPLNDEALNAWAIEQAPRSIEDRAWERFSRTKRTRRFGTWMTAAAAACAVALPFLVSDRAPVTSGPMVAEGRTTWTIDGRAVAVAENGSRLSWRAGPSGSTRVNQASGDVFYRIDPGGPFEVFTPAGAVRALGTCFRVEVKEMELNRTTLAIAGAASVATAAALVTVYEGRAALSDDRELGPGDTALITQPSLLEPAPDLAAQELEGRVEEQAATIERLRSELAAERSAARPPPIPPAEPAPPRQWSDDGLDERFASESRDEPWAAAREDFLFERMTEYMDISEEHASVECRSHCCDVQLLPDEIGNFGHFIHDFKSDVGIGIGHTEWNDLDVQGASESQDGLGHVFACSSRSLETSGEPLEGGVDRGGERARLLEQARPALDACSGQLRTPLDVVIDVTIDQHGAIADVDTTANPVGEPAARCVEEAVLSAAQFEPAPYMTWFPIRVSLQPRAP